MARHDLLGIGLKLLGVYFAVLGFVHLAGVIPVIGQFQAFGYVLAAFILVHFTENVMRSCGEATSVTRPPDSLK